MNKFTINEIEELSKKFDFSFIEDANNYHLELLNYALELTDWMKDAKDIISKIFENKKTNSILINSIILYQNSSEDVKYLVGVNLGAIISKLYDICELD